MAAPHEVFGKVSPDPFSSHFILRQQVLVGHEEVFLYFQLMRLTSCATHAHLLDDLNVSTKLEVEFTLELVVYMASIVEHLIKIVFGNRQVLTDAGSSARRSNPVAECIGLACGLQRGWDLGGVEVRFHH